MRGIFKRDLHGVFIWLFVAALTCSAFTTGSDQADVQLTCFRAQKATNQCHFNFTIDGARYRYVDIGCKYAKKQDEVVRKAKEGTLALAKDWKIDCGNSIKKPL